jgi:hypothetical protein
VSAVTVGEIQAGIEITREQDSEKAREIEDWLDSVGVTAILILVTLPMLSATLVERIKTRC